jgi:hypothetical protein
MTLQGLERVNNIFKIESDRGPSVRPYETSTTQAFLCLSTLSGEGVVSKSDERRLLKTTGGGAVDEHFRAMRK